LAQHIRSSADLFRGAKTRQSHVALEPPHMELPRLFPHDPARESRGAPLAFGYCGVAVHPRWHWNEIVGDQRSRRSERSSADLRWRRSHAILCAPPHELEDQGHPEGLAARLADGRPQRSADTRLMLLHLRTEVLDHHERFATKRHDYGRRWVSGLQIQFPQSV